MGKISNGLIVSNILGSSVGPKLNDIPVIAITGSVIFSKYGNVDIDTMEPNVGLYMEDAR
jgi:hypothetical protein